MRNCPRCGHAISKTLQQDGNEKRLNVVRPPPQLQTRIVTRLPDAFRNAIAEPCYRIVSGGGRPLTNCAFAADGRTPFIADSETASTLACEVPAP